MSSNKTLSQLQISTRGGFQKEDRIHLDYPISLPNFTLFNLLFSFEYILLVIFIYLSYYSLRYAGFILWWDAVNHSRPNV